MSLITLAAKITGDSKDFTSAVKEAKAATEDFEDKTNQLNNEMTNSSSKFSNLASKARNLVAALGLVKIAGDAITYNSEIEQYQTSFEVMTGSAEKAVETVDRLKEVGAKTPFELPQLAEVTQLLMNYGFTADDAMDKMMMLGDISQGNADKMSRIATAYGQMSSAGKVSLEDIKQMIEAGFNPLQEISESTGESMDSLYDRISKGTISVDEITDSMIRSTSQGGKYFQSMQKQSDTLSGKLSTLKDTVQEKLGSAFLWLSDLLRDDLIPLAIDMLTNTEDYIPMLTLLGIGLGTLTAAYAANALGITTLTGATGVWAGVCGLATTVTGALGAAFTFLTTPIGLIILAIGALIAIGYLLISNWEKVQNFFAAMWPSVQIVFNNFKEWLGNVFTKDLQFGVLVEYLNAFLFVVSTIFSGVKQVFIGVIEFIAGVFSGDWERAWQGVVGIFEGIFNTIVAIAKAPLNGVIGLINAAIDGLNSISVSIPEWVPFVGGQTWGISLPKIPYLLHGTQNWMGGFAFMNEGGRGELVNLPNGSQVIPHDISVKYAQEAARSNSVVFNNEEIVQMLMLIADRLNEDSLHEVIFGAVSECEFAVDWDDREVGRLVKAHA